VKLDQESLTESPILARLVNESAIGISGALELLSDDYRPPKPPIMKFTRLDLDEDEEDDTEDEVVLIPYEGEHGYPEGEAPSEVDAEGYPAIVEVARVAAPTPASGVKLIRPRSLSDMNHAS
jgi:hypothetical protein